MPALRTATALQLVLLAGIFVLNLLMVTDPDLWWHLATGRYIVETGVIPHTDPFSYTMAGQPWVAHEWLAEILMYLLYRSGGYLVPVLFFASLVTFTFWVVFRSLRLLGLTAVGASCVTFWVAMMSLAGFNVRPQVFSYLFFALYLYVLLRVRQTASRRLWFLPALMVLWVNLHAGYVTGLLLLFLFLLGDAVVWLREQLPTARWRRRKSAALEERSPGEDAQSAWDPPRKARPLLLRRHLAEVIVTVAATAVNPQGLSMLLYPFTYAGTQNASMKYILEWQSPDFHDYFFFLFAGSMMVLMVVPSRRAVDWAIALPMLVLAAMSLQSVRVIPFYAIASAPFLGVRLALPGISRQGSDMGEGGNWESVAVSLENSSPTSGRSRATPWNWLLLALCLAALTLTVFVSGRAQLGPEPRTADYPVAGVEYIRQAGLTGNLLNTYHWGGFLIWSFYPERKVFIDGRADMYGDQFVEKYQKTYRAGPGWRDVLDEYRVNVALIEKDSQLAVLLSASGEWEEVFRGDIESVFVRSAGSKAGGPGE